MRRDGSINEAGKISLRKKLLFAGLSFAGGMLCAASLPPLNLCWAAGFSLFPLLLAAERYRCRFLALCGWLWGLGWSLFAFRFLREIEAVIPWLLAPVLSLWPALWAAGLPFFRAHLLFPAEAALWNVSEKEEYLRSRLPARRVLLYTLTAAAAFTLLEWTRSRLFVWNDFSVTQWKNLPLIQIAAWTGSYGVGFLTAWLNTGIFALVHRKRGLPAFLTAIFFFAAAMGIGLVRLHAEPEKTRPARRIGLVQCDLSQRRNPTAAQAVEALNKSIFLSRQVARQKPEIILWPECAVPAPYRGSTSFCARYRQEVTRLIWFTETPMLIGALDFSGDGRQMTNSALLFDKEGKLTGKYDKIRRVPFGEYVPFRKLLPEALIRWIDMGRDLAPGNDFTPLEILPGCRAGVAICYEGVFGCLTREFAREGADVLIVLSNDAWYPRSSEPEQHLANAVLRAVETGLPMIRCGNNGGSGIVTPQGRFTQYIGSPSERPELLRETAAGIVTLALPEEKKETFYVRCGEWIILLLWLGFSASAVLSLRTAYRKNAMRRQMIEGESSAAGNEDAPLSR